jgi:hypothetical protein
MSTKKNKESVPKPPPSRKKDGKYVILMETNGEESESWYYFIRLNGNEESLKHLNKQLEQVDWVILDDLSTFDLDLEHPVSAQTAIEMCKVDLNAYSYHRKFDGTLQKIDLEFSKKDGNETKICKTYDRLSFGAIENFIDDEDLNSDMDYDIKDDRDTDNESVYSSD